MRLRALFGMQVLLSVLKVESLIREENPAKFWSKEMPLIFTPLEVQVNECQKVIQDNHDWKQRQKERQWYILQMIDDNSDDDNKVREDGDDENDDGDKVDFFDDNVDYTHWAGKIDG